MLHSKLRWHRQRETRVSLGSWPGPCSACVLLPLKPVWPRASSPVRCVCFQRALTSCRTPWSSLSPSLAVGWWLNWKTAER